ncbi:MAG: YncE family protein [Solirubrobacterales bacterium]
MAAAVQGHVRWVLAAGLAAVLCALVAAPAEGREGPPPRPETRQVMFVGNNWDGTADIIDAKTFEKLARINTIPDKAERMAEIMTSPDKLAFFLAIREAVGEGNDQYTDDMFSSHDGRFMYVSRPSFADVVGIDLRTQEIVWRFPMEGYRADHMGISPGGTRLLVSDSTANIVHVIDPRTGAGIGRFESGDSPHENNYTEDGTKIFHASIGRVYTPTDRSILGLVRDTSKGERYLQVVDSRTNEILKRWDIGKKLEEAGYPEMSSAVRPMAVAPGERFVYLQVSFFHGYVEFDLEQEKVTDVVELPISEEAKDIPREQYLLDSAHHGLAINEAGTKLCVAGTMSDYAAIVNRATKQPKLFDIGRKPYWSTNDHDSEHCWVSSSGDDQVVVLDYETEKEVATIKVGDHPQRVRAAAIRRNLVEELPQATDSRAPRVSASGVGSRCRSASFVMRVTVDDQSSLRSAQVAVGSRLLRSTKAKSFRVRVPVHSQSRRQHRVRIRVTDSAGNTQRRVVRFSRCARGSQGRTLSLTG